MEITGEIKIFGDINKFILLALMREASVARKTCFFVYI